MVHWVGSHLQSPCFNLELGLLSYMVSQHPCLFPNVAFRSAWNLNPNEELQVQPSTNALSFDRS